MIAPPLRSTLAVPPLPPAPPSPPQRAIPTPGIATIAPDRRRRRWRATRTRLIAPCRSTTAGRPCRPSHRYRPRRPGSCLPCPLSLNRRQRHQPPRTSALPHRFQGHGWCHGGEHHRAAGAARAAIARELCKESKEGWIVYSAIAALASERMRDEPERRQTGDSIRHESAVDETHRHIAASATGTAIAALDIVIIRLRPLSPPDPPLPPRLTIGAPKLSVLGPFGLKPPMIVRTLFVLLIWPPDCPGLPGPPDSPEPPFVPTQPPRPNDVTLYGTNGEWLPKTLDWEGQNWPPPAVADGLLLELHCACAAAGAMT